MVLPILALIETPPGDNIINYFLLFAFLKFHRIISHRRVASRGSSRLWDTRFGPVLPGQWYVYLSTHWTTQSACQHRPVQANRATARANKQTKAKRSDSDFGRCLFTYLSLCVRFSDTISCLLSHVPFSFFSPLPLSLFLPCFVCTGHDIDLLTPLLFVLTCGIYREKKNRK